MTITPSSLAAINGVSVKNEQFAVTAGVIAQKNIIVGNYDEATFTGLAVDTPFQVFSPEDVGSKTGFGFMLHRLAVAAFKAGNVETWVIPQAENGSAVVSAGEIDYTGSTGIEAGTLALYIAGDRVPVTVTDAMSIEELADATVAAINADADLPVTAVKVAVTFEVTVTAKQKGTYGNAISIEFNLKEGESLPTGIVTAVTDMASGTTVGDISGALTALGSGDDQNGKFFTNFIHGYGYDITTLDAISVYNGLGNDFVGNYAKEVARPFRSLIGDTVAGSGGLTAALAIGVLRKVTDRTNGQISIPGSPNHPQEIAAQMMGIMAVTNSTLAEESYIDVALDGIYPGAIADRWTSDGDNRDTAVKGGISPSLTKNGIVYAQNVVTYYHPDSIASASNGYRSMRNISIIQNMLSNYRANFDREKWQGITIVADTADVTNVESKKKARDVDSVLDDLVALADEFAENAWLYSAEYTKDQLAVGDKVTLRAGLSGFDITFPVILSGEGGIFNSVIEFDTSIAILGG